MRSKGINLSYLKLLLIQWAKIKHNRRVILITDKNRPKPTKAVKNRQQPTKSQIKPTKADKKILYQINTEELTS